MTTTRRVSQSLRVLVEGPLGPICVIGILILLFLMIALPSNWTHGGASQEFNAIDEYWSLKAKINDLEIRELSARRSDPNADTTALDKELSPLRARFAQLQASRDQELAETTRLVRELVAKR